MKMEMVSPDEIPKNGYTQTYKFLSGKFEPKNPITAPLVKKLGSFVDNGLVCEYLEWSDGKKELLIFSETKPELGYELKTNFEVTLVQP